jgi:predicted MFS family arabinose efflux permease
MVPVVVAAGVWAGAFGPAASMFQNAAVRAGALTPEIAGAWINSTANIGIGGGALVGGLVMDAAGTHGLTWAGCAILVAALVVIGASRRAFPRRP